MLIVGTKLGESLREKKELKHLLRNNTYGTSDGLSIARRIKLMGEMFFMGRSRRMKPTRLLLCFTMMALVSTLFSYAALFEAYSNRVNLRSVLYSDVFDISLNILNTELAQINGKYSQNNALALDSINTMYSKAKISDTDIDGLAKEHSLKLYTDGSQEYLRAYF